MGLLAAVIKNLARLYLFAMIMRQAKKAHVTKDVREQELAVGKYELNPILLEKIS